MSDSLINDNAINSAASALNGLSMRQQAISRNLANVDTPGYHAQDVNFEDAIKQALNQSTSLPLQVSDPLHLQPGQGSAAGPQMIERTGGTLRADQNNVDINTELTDMTATGIEYQAISTAASQKLMLLKSLAEYH